MSVPGTFYRFRLLTACCLFVLLTIATAAYGAVDSGIWALVAAGTLGLGVIWGVRFVTKPAPFVRTWLYLPLGLLSVTAGLQSLFGLSAAPYAAGGGFLFWLTLTLWFVLLVNTLDDTSIRRGFVRVLPWSIGLLAILGIVQKYTAPLRAYWLREAPGAQLFGGYANQNHFSALLALAFPVALYLALNERVRGRVIYTALCFMLIAGGLFAGSYSGCLILAAELWAILLIHTVFGLRSGSSRKRAQTMIAGAAMATAAVVLTIATLSGSFFPEALERGLSADRLADGMSRTLAASGAWAMFLDAPLLGNGAGSFADVFPSHAPVRDGYHWNHALNDPLEVAAEMGLVGLAAPLLMFAFALGRRRSLRVWMTAIIPLLAAFGHSLLETPLSTPSVPLTALALLALIPTDIGVAVRSGADDSAEPEPPSREKPALVNAA